MKKIRKLISGITAVLMLLCCASCSGSSKKKADYESALPLEEFYVTMETLLETFTGTCFTEEELNERLKRYGAFQQSYSNITVAELNKPHRTIQLSEFKLVKPDNLPSGGRYAITKLNEVDSYGISRGVEVTVMQDGACTVGDSGIGAVEASDSALKTNTAAEG